MRVRPVSSHLGPVGEFVDRQCVGLVGLGIVRGNEAQRASEGSQADAEFGMTLMRSPVDCREKGIRWIITYSHMNDGFNSHLLVPDTKY